VGTHDADLDAAIIVEDLHMTYGRLHAVDGLSFRVARGDIYALLGPNGAGKTTTVEILEGHRHRTSGHVRVLGHDPSRSRRRFRQRIGIVLQSGGIDAELTVEELVRLYATFYAAPRDAAETIDQVRLTDKRRARARTLSGGQLRRLDLALALIGDPDLIFLDEPTTGFDPTARRSAWDMIDRLRGLGKTVLLTSHYLDEVQRLADRVGVLRHGRLIAESAPAELGGRDLAETTIRFRLPDLTSITDLPIGPWHAARNHGGLVAIYTDLPTEALLALTSWAVDRGRELEALTVTQPSLEDTYLKLTEAHDAS
jgi:ABC-2 type transport system ATP-binding protein